MSGPTEGQSEDRTSDAPKPPDGEDTTATLPDVPDDEGDVTATMPDGTALERAETQKKEKAAEAKKTAELEDESPEVEGGPITFRYFGQTDVGLIREHNEDNFLVANLDSSLRGLPDESIQEGTLTGKGILLAVCDGMGGAAAGEVASQMAVDTIYEVLESGEPTKDRDHFARRLVTAVEEAGSRIFSAAKMDRSRRGMGTTATVAGLIDKVLFVGQVGDSRAYVLRNGEVRLVTKDQSLVNQLIEAGQLTEEEAEAFEHSNIILQALGTTEEVSVDLTFLELRRGDRLMLCSDGLSGLVHSDMIKEVMESTPDLRETCVRLIEMANAGGGHDNITCIVADFAGEGLAAPAAESVAAYQQYPLPLAEGASEPNGPKREPTIKTGGKKPGADVKRSPTRETIQEKAGDPEIPVAGFPWWVVIVALLLIGAAAFFTFATQEPKRTTQPVRTDPDPGRPIEHDELVGQEQEPADVLVRTDGLGGELFVDGESLGTFGDGQELEVQVAPGIHLFEHRVDGRVIASAPNVPVRGGSSPIVELRLPEGLTSAAGGDAGTDDAEEETDDTPAPPESTTMAAPPPVTMTEPEMVAPMVTTPPSMTTTTTTTPMSESSSSSSTTSGTSMTTTATPRMTAEMAPTPSMETTPEAAQPSNPFDP